MFSSLEGIVVKTVPRLIVQLLTGKECVAPPKRYDFTVGTPVNVTVDVHRQTIREVFPKLEGCCLLHDPVTIL